MGFLFEVVNHLRLTWRLFWDDGVHWWQRAVFAIPLVYLVVPFRYDLFADLAPVIGLLDDWLLALLCCYVFVAICPSRVVRRHRTAISLSDPDADVRGRTRQDLAALEDLSAVERLEMYRHPQESLALGLSLAILIGLSALGGVLLGVLLLLFLGFSYATMRIAQAQVLRSAIRASAETFPEVQACVDRCGACLPHVSVDVFVLRSPRLNAYTFGLDRPYTMVLCSRLVETLDADELTAVIGHELGHVLFEHTFLSSLMGGMLYRSGVAGFVWALAFFRWRRFAELTADRISLLACGQLSTSLRALIRLASGAGDEVVDLDAIVGQVYAEERTGLSTRLGEFVRTHPYLATRVRALVEFDAELLAQDVEMWLAADSAS